MAAGAVLTLPPTFSGEKRQPSGEAVLREGGWFDIQLIVWVKMATLKTLTLAFTATLEQGAP